MLFERGIDICHETVRFWWNRFGPMFAAEIRKRRVLNRSYSNWRWHLDEVFVRINGETHYLWRAVDHEGEVLEVFATKRRNRAAALAFLKRAMKRYGRPKIIVTDRPKVLPGSDECDRECRRSGMRPLAEQPGGKLTSTVSTKGRGDVEIQRRKDPTEIRRRACFNLQPLQSRPPSQQPLRLQAEPLRRAGRVASVGGMKTASSAILETGSH